MVAVEDLMERLQLANVSNYMISRCQLIVLNSCKPIYSSDGLFKSNVIVWPNFCKIARTLSCVTIH